MKGERDQSEVYKTQISFSEWLQNMNHSKVNSFRKEDNEKRDRLGVLNAIIGLPYDKETSFEALDLVNNSNNFLSFLESNGEDLCALRLVPKDPSLPKLRLRGLKVKEVMRWFKEQDIDPSKYDAHFCPHANYYLWSSIFVINNKGIFGEVIKGSHYQLTQGFHDVAKPINFSYDFNEWKFSDDNEEAREHVKELLSHLKIENKEIQSAINDKFGACFVNDFLTGYFETVKSEDKGLWFVDYNQTLVEIYNEIMPVFGKREEFLQGQPASLGRVIGKVKIVGFENVNLVEIDNHILVCEVTTPEYFNLMQKSLGIITNFGGVLSHAGIVARELGKPCIVGTENATKLLKDGDLIELDADNGIVRKLS